MTTYYIRGSTIYLDYQVDGKRYQRSTKLKNTPENIRKVKTKMIPALDAKIATGKIFRQKSKKFEHYGRIFLTSKESNRSYELKKGYWSKVIAYFRGRDIDSITRLEVKQFLGSLQMKSRSKNSYKSCVKEIFELAVDDGVISFNPALNIRLRPDVKEPVESYTREEVGKIMTAAKGVMKAYLYIAFNTGMRVGEILGLQLGDFKDDGYIHIRRTRTKGTIGTGKTNNAIRKVPYPAFVLEAARKVQPKGSLFIFGDMDDAIKLRTPWMHTCRDAGVRRLRLYSTRHTFATLMLQENIVSLNELAGLLGHSSPKITLEHYASIINAKNIDLGADFSLFCDKMVTVEDEEAIKARKIGVYKGSVQL